jgi:hypothetical protein
MSEDENFFARWSRRKREASESNIAPVEKKAEPMAPVEGGQDNEAQPQTAGGVDETAFDLSKLPSLDSITADTDIRAFWLPGVPESLRHAALRRAWAADPAIRDFVGPAEYAWDFTAPDTMAGFGPLDPAEVPRLMKQLLDAQLAQKEQARETGDESSAEAAQSVAAIENSSQEASVSVPGSPQAPPALAQGADEPAIIKNNLLQCSGEPLGASEEEQQRTLRSAHFRHGHGRALPK